MNYLRLWIALSIIVLLWMGCEKVQPKHTQMGGTLPIDKKIGRRLDIATQQKDITKGLFMIRALYQLPTDSGTHAVICQAMARWHFVNGYSDTVVLYIKEALPYMEQHTGFTRMLADCYYMLGQSIGGSSKPNSFLANYYQTKAALLCNSPGVDSILNVTFRMGMFFLASESNRYCQLYPASLRYGYAAVKLGGQYQDSVPEVYIRSLTEYAKILIEIKQYDSAWKCCMTAKVFNENKLQSDLMGRDIDGTLGAWFFAKEQLDSAAHYCLRSIAYDEQQVPLDSIALFSGYYSMLGINNQLHRPHEAKRFLDKAEKLLAHSKNISDAATLKNFTINKMQYEILYGNPTSTGNLFYDYVQQEKDFYNKEQLKMEEAVYAEYDLANKEQKIQALNIQRLKSESELQTRNNLLAIAALATLLAIATVIVLVLLQRQRKLKNAQQLLSVEHNKIELEQRLLRTQMEPHFIFNTLTNLLTLIDKGENKKASGYVLRFANLLRTNLENSKESFVLLSEELSALENYLELQKMRFNNLFDFEISVDEEVNADNILIPPMLIQPLVENAIIHGFKGIEYKGLIQISIRKSNGLLHCTVLDNGTGYRPIQNSNRQVSSRTITSERLAILSRYTGQQASLEIINEPDGKRCEG